MKKQKKPRIVTEIDGKPLYKYFLSEMRSPYGKDLKWSLPQLNGRRAGTFTPGAWKVFSGKPTLCVRGLHAYVGATALLRQKLDKSYYQVFRVEVDLKGSARMLTSLDDKIAVRRMRLLYPILPGSPEYIQIAGSNL